MQMPEWRGGGAVAEALGETHRKAPGLPPG